MQRWSSKQPRGDTPGPRAKEKPQKDAFRINPHSHKKSSEGSNKPCVHQDPGTPQRPRQNCVWASPVKYRSAVVCCRDGDSGCGYGISPLGGGRHSPHYRAARTYIGLGNRLLEGTTALCAPGPRRKEKWPHRRFACGDPGVSGEGMGPWWPATGFGAWTVAEHVWDPLRGIIIIFIASTIVWPQVSSMEGIHLHPSTENWIKHLLSMAPTNRTRPSIPLSLSHQEAFISLLSFSIRGQTDWKWPSQKTNQSNHIDHSLV